MAVIHGLYRSMVNEDVCTELSHLKPKYHSYFPARCVFRNIGTDVT